MVSRENLGKAAGWITQPQTMIGNWVGQQVGGRIKNNNERVENKNQTFSANNYKSNLDMPTYNSRYPGFDEANYKKLEQMAVNRGLTGGDMIQFMDEAYQYYYPQVLNEYGLNMRAEEINKTASENGGAILNGNKTAEWNMKLVDLSQTFKRVKGVAYDYPDEQVIDALKTRIPDGEQLLLNYLNNGDDTILYKAGLKKTDAQVKLDEYNKRKENINKALQQNWKQLSDDGVKYLRNYNVLFQTVDEARMQGMGQGMTDDELLLNLLYISPELQQIEKELGTLNLDHGDKAILGIEDDSKRAIRPERHETVNTVRDWLGWNGDNPATLDDLAEEIYVRENMDGQTWKNAKANWRNRGDSLAKFGYRVPRDINNLSLETELQFNDNLSQEDIDRIREKIGRNKQDVQAFNEATDREQQNYKKQIGLDPIIENYYNNQGVIESLFNNNLGGAWYKGVGEAAGNIDTLVGIPASIINPAFGLAIMGTDTFARENQEAFETLINAQTKQGVSYEDAYNNASKGAVVVGVINTAIELGLEKFLGGVETTTANNIKQMATRNLNKEVNDMLVKRGIMDMLAQGLETQARASLEEGMEEVFQQLVQNIAESEYDPDKKISEGLWRAFESGALNPMNLLAGGSELLTNNNQIKEAMYNSAYDAGVITRNVVDALNPKSIVSNIKNNMRNKSENGIVNNNEGTVNNKNNGIIDRITDWGAEKITNTVSNQDKLYKAQEPRMNILTRAKDLEQRRSNSDRANELIIMNGFTPTDTTSRLQAHDQTMKNVWKQVEEKINGGKEIMVDLSQISDVLDEYIKKQKRTKSTLTKTDLERLKREADALRGQQITLPDAEALKQLYNATINNRGEEKVSDTLANGLKKATHEIGVIEDNLLSEIPGEFQGLKNDFGALKDTYEDVFKADMKNQRRKGMGLAETYSRLEGLGDIVNGVLGVVTGKGDIASVGKGAAKLLVGKSLAKASDVDFLIEQGFKGLRTELEESQPGNQAQELYNQGDENLSPNSEQMETTKKTTKKKTTKKGKKGDSTQVQYNGEDITVTKLEDGYKVEFGPDDYITVKDNLIGDVLGLNIKTTRVNNEGNTTTKPIEVKSIDSEGNWLANDEGGIKINYHPDGYLDVKLTKYPSSDEMIGFEQFKYEPIKEVELTILDEQTGKPVRSNRVNSINELLEYLEDYFINGNTDI